MWNGNTTGTGSNYSTWPPYRVTKPSSLVHHKYEVLFRERFITKADQATVAVPLSCAPDDPLGVLVPVVLLASFLLCAVFAFRWQRKRERNYHVKQVEEGHLAHDANEVLMSDKGVDNNNNSPHRVMADCPEHCHLVSSPPHSGCNSWCSRVGEWPPVAGCSQCHLSWVSHFPLHEVASCTQDWINTYGTPTDPSLIGSPEALSSVFTTPTTCERSRICAGSADQHALGRTDGIWTPAVQNTCRLMTKNMPTDRGIRKFSDSQWSAGQCACRLMSGQKESGNPYQGVVECWV